MTRPELVIFDMDDVLCHYDLGRRLRALAKLADVTARDVRAAVWDSGFEDLADQGGYSEIEHYLNEFSKRIGRTITLDQWIAARSEAMTPNHEVLAVAQKIATQAKLAIYTNNGPVVKNHLDLLFPEAAAIFDMRFCSYEFGTKKPDPESYRRLLKALHREPAQCWFIDDKKSNVEGARIAGLRAHHYTGFAKFASEAAAQGFEL
ncbi:HAD family hydrolase [Aestuariivirga litoralis]|uniref:HAD family hydrolase n=1 Tax=Aestuariivirga litoralis TaxID=2650924 RepID=UPI0018C55D49|nr:HAD family phosphatase [Aestuariivirga litoralis]MBG1233427.1 HAD family phosphatase [Aestuariivirga litoralis]